MLSEMIEERFVWWSIGEPLDEFRKTARNIRAILDQGFDRRINLLVVRKQEIVLCWGYDE
jgi:hypothetical protein